LKATLYVLSHKKVLLEYKMEYKDHKIYPSLPASAPDEGTAQSFRLQKINEIQKEIAIERDKR
jgi:hypothetical protein